MNTQRKSLKKWNKKGNIMDIVYFPILLFATAVALFIIYFVWTSISGELDTNLTPYNTDAGTFIDNVSGGLGMFDTMFPVFMAGVILMMIVSAYLIDS